MDKTSKAKRLSAEKSAEEKTPPPSRRIKEIHFLDYVQHKETHKHIEEIGIRDYLDRKKLPDAS
jgi:hypothetical protein